MLISSIVGLVRMTTKCCGYGTNGADTTRGFDCALIPGATKLAVDANGNAQTLAGAGNAFCGGELGTVTNMNAAATVCCKYRNLKKYLSLYM